MKSGVANVKQMQKVTAQAVETILLQIYRRNSQIQKGALHNIEPDMERMYEVMAQAQRSNYNSLVRRERSRDKLKEDS
jgi:hypothetical protein